MNIFKLFGSVFVDTDAAEKSIAKTDKKAQGLGTTLVNGAKKVGKFGLALGGMAVVGSGAILGLAKGVGNMADGLLDLSSTTGMSTDEIQKWQRVTTVAGVSADAMTNASKKLTKTLDTMSTGTGKAAEAAAALGFTYDDLMSMNADERMNAIVDAMGSITDTTARAKIGTDLFGSSWDELAPILDVGAESIKEIKDNANIISQSDLEAANKFRISMDKMKERATVFGQQLILKLMPTLNKMFDWIDAHMPEIEQFFDDAFVFIGDVVQGAIDIFNEYLLPVLVDIFNWVKNHMPEIKAAFNTAVDAIGKSVTWLIDVFNEYLLPVFIAIFDWVKENWPTLQEMFTTYIGLIITAVEAWWSVFEVTLLPILKAVLDWVMEHWPEIADAIEVAIEVITIVVEAVIATLQDLWDIFVFIFDYVKNNFITVGDTIKAAFDGVSDFLGGIKDAFDSVVGAISNAIDVTKEFLGLQSKASGTKKGSSGSLHGGGGGTFGEPGLATGGDILKGGMVTVGEQGKESVFLPTGARVAPLDKTAGTNLVVTLEGATFVNEQSMEDLADLMTNYIRGQGVLI